MSLLDTASLVITPNGYKEGKLYSVVPSDGSGDLNVTRATTATRVNASGLVELVPYNYIRYSEDFTNGNWFKLGTSFTVTGNTTTAPDGTLTADTLNVSNNDNILYQSASSGYNLTGNTYTFSIYAKGTGTFAMNVRLNSSTTTTETKTLTSQWQRFQVSVTDLASITSIESYLVLNTSSTYYVWGAQLVEGSTAKDYQKTETRLNIPRLDYSNGTCPSILVEPQRTNLNLYTEDLTNAWYSKFNSSISANAINSPMGTLTADKVVENTANSFHYIETTNSLVNSSTYTVSAFLKKGERTFGFIGVYTFESKQIRVNLTNGTIDNTVGTWISTSIEDYGNDWYRVIGTFSAGSTTYFFTGSALNATTVSYLGDGTSGIYIWGAQLELGSYATSYIPTTSASVTRNADVISKTGISSLIGQTEGTLFLDFYYDGVSSNFVLMQLFDSATPFNLIQYYLDNSKKISFEVGGTGAIADLNVLATGRNKIAGAYKNNDFVLYINGTQIGTDSSGSVIATNSITLNDFYALPNAYKQVMDINLTALWKTRLTNTQLAQLTTI